MATLNPAVGVGAFTETLADLRTRLLRRMGYGNQLSLLPPGVQEIANDYLQDAQTQLCRQYPQHVTERFYTWLMVAGTRFYALTSSDDVEGATSPEHVLDKDRISWVGIEDLNGSFYPLIEGIPPEYYTQEANQGLPARYEIRQAIEVMPSPAGAYTLTVKGHTKNFAFTGDTDVATIDPEAIFLHALASYKDDKGQPGAQKYFAQLTTYIGNLTYDRHGTARYIPGTSPQPPATRPTLV